MTALFPNVSSAFELEAKDISVSRGDNILFEGLSVTISSHEVLWIQGDNGVGKTTLLEALTGLNRPDKGAISWKSGNVDIAPDLLMAYQPHRSFSKGSLTTKEDLAFWAKLHGSLNLVDESISLVGLTERRDVPTQNLSAGQRRRLSLAKLIISNRPIWVMDEPSAAMDKTGVALIDGIVKNHIERGGSAIIASHNTSRPLSSNTRKLTLQVSS